MRNNNSSSEKASFLFSVQKSFTLTQQHFDNSGCFHGNNRNVEQPQRFRQHETYCFQKAVSPFPWRWRSPLFPFQCKIWQKMTPHLNIICSETACRRDVKVA
uniref:Uncharacterized protein n=1 Tax=Salarias fasciatus TaxID=181472 RepID=A0A672GZ52_SALFA